MAHSPHIYHPERKWKDLSWKKRTFTLTHPVIVVGSKVRGKAIQHLKGTIRGLEYITPGESQDQDPARSKLY